MRTSRYLYILAAFLIMISSVLTLYRSNPKTVVYVNIGAMAAIAVAVSITNFKNRPKDNM